MVSQAQTSYINPKEDLINRPYYAQESKDYTIMLNRLITEFSQPSNSSYYCPYHHSVETRHTKPQHGSKAFTRGQLIGFFSIVAMIKQ